MFSFENTLLGRVLSGFEVVAKLEHLSSGGYSSVGLEIVASVVLVS